MAHGAVTANTPENVAANLLPVCGAPGCQIVARPEQPLCDDHAVQQRVLAARRRLAEHAPLAAEQLIDLCDNADHADVRRRAAEAILDRVGVRPGVDVAVTARTDGKASPAEILRAKIETLRQRTIEGIREDHLPAAIEAWDEGSESSENQSGGSRSSEGTSQNVS